MPFSNDRPNQTKTGIQQVLIDIVKSLNGIYSCFCVDTDGLLIDEVNLEGTLGKESSLILCSLVAGIQSNMDTIGKEIGSSPWVSFTSESSNFKFFLRTMGGIAFLGVLSDPYVDLELLKLIVEPGVDTILHILEQWPLAKHPKPSISYLSISQKEIDEILEMEK